MHQRIKRWSMLILCLISLPVSAHNVVAGAYVEGMMIEGEIGLSNGETALPGVLVEVFDEAGAKLGETQIEEDGLFSFVASSAQQHIIKANLGAGHVANIVIEADEFSATSSVAKNASKADGSAVMREVGSANNTALAAGVSVAELESIVRKAVSQQVKPLQKELRAYKEKVMLRDIAGGIGFIFGLFGVAAWIASRKAPRSELA